MRTMKHIFAALIIVGLSGLIFYVVMTNYSDNPEDIPLEKSFHRDVTLKDGELYETSGKGTSKITSTDGKIGYYLVSPDKYYVAYSVLVGFHEIVPIEGEADIRPVYNIVIMDLDQKKQLIEIKPQSQSEPFINADRWISNEELILTEADGFATGYRYIYHAGENVLRLAEPEEMNL